jgi:hypothetical protein|tara:strand:- start:55 stop:252 length:198 start_codon:yes stop_codon:yes gene_type:complete
MDCEDDKKWFKDKEERVPSFIGAAVRLQPRTPTPAHTALCFLRPKKIKVANNHVKSSFALSLFRC